MATPNALQTSWMVTLVSTSNVVVDSLAFMTMSNFSEFFSENEKKVARYSAKIQQHNAVASVSTMELSR